jgi:glycosyltransferase involved in cell wall biosynthesis
MIRPRHNPSARSLQIRTVGHPSAPIGMGEHVRSVFHALCEAGAEPLMVDIYGPRPGADAVLMSTYADALDPKLGDGINIFCINGDEVDGAFHMLQARNLRAPHSKNIIYPAWELDRYPDEWARKLEQFDEIWAPSKFIKSSIERSTKSPVLHMPLACEIGKRALRSRRRFGIRESSFAYLFSFDFLSYVERKNPFAVIDAFRILLTQRPYADVTLVIKTNNSDQRPDMKRDFDAAIEGFHDRVVVIDEVLSDLEMKSLVWLIDCYVSLHRSEGFGRGISEAMALGKPVIATAFSGNMDFCSEENAFLVPYIMSPVPPGAYPHWQGQQWADPDTDVAGALMIHLLDNPSAGSVVGRRARLNIRRNYSYLERGQEYLKRCQSIICNIDERDFQENCSP